MKQFSLPKIMLWLWRIFGVVLIATGACCLVYRYLYGLGAATNLSDEAPWGLWKGFNVICGVGLAAGGFTLCAMVHLFNLHRFKPILRPAVLTAFLGYSLVVSALLVDLGRPLNIWHVIIMWNHHSVLFEVSWCIMLYATVLAVEFSPVVFERFGFVKLQKLVHAVTLPLVLVGVLLSTLHQSSLGSLFLIVPNALHPFWYSPLLPVFFLLSAVAVGLGVMVLQSLWSRRALGRGLEMPLVGQLARIMVVVLLVYATVKVLDFTHRDLWPMMLSGSREATLAWIEFALFIAVPVMVLGIPRLARTQAGLLVGAGAVVLGFMVNRLNVSILGIGPTMRAGYVPSLMELSITAGMVALGFWVFAVVAKYFPVFVEPAARKTTVEKIASVGVASGNGHAVPAGIDVACGCGKRIRVAVQYAGRRGKCSTCGKLIVVPAVPRSALGPVQSD